MSGKTSESEKEPLIKCDMQTGEPDNCCSTNCCRPHSTSYRYTLLVFLCLIGVGAYFCGDNPAALQEHMLKDMSISETQYMGFYSSKQWTSIVSCFFGGFLIDRKLGNRLGVTLFSSLLTLAQVVFATGALFDSYMLMNIGRALFGVMTGPMSIANDNITVKWFKVKQLNMVFGLRTSIACLGSVLNMNVMEPIYNYVGRYFTGHTCLGVTLFAGVAMCLVSTFSACIAVVFDKRADTISNHSDEARKSSIKNEKIKLADVGRFPLTYWLITMTTTTYYLAMSPFVALALVYFEMKYNYEPQMANNVNSLISLIPAVTMPLFGLCIDKTGKNLIWLLFGITISLGGHALLAFTFVSPYVAMAMLGTGNSVFTAASWPLVAYMVNRQHLCTAYGITTAVICVGQGAITYLAGYLADTRGYLVLEVFFLVCMCVALIFGALLYVVDSTKVSWTPTPANPYGVINGPSYDGYLNLTRAERSIYKEMHKSEQQSVESQMINTNTC